MLFLYDPTPVLKEMMPVGLDALSLLIDGNVDKDERNPRISQLEDLFKN